MSKNVELKIILDKIETLDRALSKKDKMLKLYRALAIVGCSYMAFNISLYLWCLIFKFFCAL